VLTVGDNIRWIIRDLNAERDVISLAIEALERVEDIKALLRATEDPARTSLHLVRKEITPT
jgi:hypothetical protein